MILRPAKNSLKELMLEIALGKKIAKQAVFEHTQYGIGVTEGQSANKPSVAISFRHAFTYFW